MSVAVSIAPSPVLQFFDNQGRPCVGGSVLTQVGGVNAAAYQDSAGTVPLPNPIPLNSRGEVSNASGTTCQLFLLNGSTYTLTLFDANGNQLNQATYVVGASGGLATFTTSLLSSAGAAQVGFIQSGVGAILRTVQDKLREGISVEDFGAVGDGVVDDTTAIQAALQFLAVTSWTGSQPASYSKGGGTLKLTPGKRYLVTDTLRVGANTTIESSGPGGATAPSITTNTGAVIVWGGAAGAMKWVLSSATFNASDGSFASVLAQYGGTDYDAAAMTFTHGIRIRGISINCGGAYGGIRLLASSDFDVQDCMVWNCAAPYYFNTCFGGRYGGLRSIFGLYGALVINCTALQCGQSYHDKDPASTWVVSNATRMVSTFDMSVAAFLPADWTNKTFGLYASGCIGMRFDAQTCEHANVGVAFAHVSDFTLSGYFEGNIDSDCTFVASTGAMTVFANDTTTSHIKYHFGTLNSVTMDGCSIGAVYMGETVTNKVRIVGGDTAGAAASDWTWSDVIDFQTVGRIIRVSAAGVTTAVLGYTTLDEALRRIGASAGDRREWVVRIKDGDTVATAAQQSFSDKNIRFERESGGARPTISVGAAGGGFVYRNTVVGECVLTFRNCNVSFPTAIVGVAGDRGLFLIAANTEATLRLNWQSGNLNLGDAYALVQVVAGGALRVDASWTDAGITSTAPGPIVANSGAALITSIASSSVTCDANIKGLAGTTNGWQGTVLNSNF